MIVEETFRRDPTEKAATPSIFVAEPKVSHRPTTRYRSVRIRTKEDVETARRAGLPLTLLEPATVERLGYPLSFRPRLLLPRSFESAVETTFRRLTFSDPTAAKNPTIEDIVVAMLSIDALGARRIAYENRNAIDPVRLLKRVLAEDLEGRAFEVRLGDFAPGIPKVPGVSPLSRATLDAEDRRLFSWGGGR
jgi:hypothetical protein